MNFYNRRNIDKKPVNTAAAAAENQVDDEGDEIFEDEDYEYESDWRHKERHDRGCFCKQECFPQHNCFCGSQQCFPQCCYPKPHCKCPPGPRGPRGPRGLRGPKGEGSDGAIIPFASGNTLVALTTVVNESNALTTGYVAAIGFGETQNGNTFGVGGELALAAGNMAFSVPRNIRITDITAFFTNTAQLTLGASAIQISAQLFYSPATDIAFLPLPGTRVNLTPVLTGVVPANSVFTGSLKDLKVSVLSGTKLVLVFFARLVSGPSIAVTITGNAGAGVNIA